jgi:hypothetical protein
MVEMVHDHITAGETTVVSTAVVLRCGKQMEKLPHYNFSWTDSLQKQRNSLEGAMDLSRDRLILELVTITWKLQDLYPKCEFYQIWMHFYKQL